MTFTFWLFVSLVATDVTQIFGTHDQFESELQHAHPDKYVALKNFLQKALGPRDFYYKDVLMRVGIVPQPPGYENMHDDLTTQTVPLEVTEHFEKHIKDTLTSSEKFTYALDHLMPSDVGNREDSQQQMKESTSATDSQPEVTSDGATSRSPSSEPLESQDLPEEFVSHSELPPINYLETSTSIVDKISSEYVKLSTEMSESTQTSNLPESTTSIPALGTSTRTPLDDDYVMHTMLSDAPILDEFNSSVEKLTSHSETKIEQSTEFMSADATAESSEKSEVKPDSGNLLPTGSKIYTFEEIMLIDQMLNLKSGFQYDVISTTPDLDADFDFFTTDKTSSSEQVKKRRRISPRDLPLDEWEPAFFQAPTPNFMLLRYYRDIPDTNFTCEGKTWPSFYADLETDCQVFHVCWPGRRESFLCPVGSLFNQAVLSCDRFNNTNCTLSHVHYSRNSAFQEYDDAQAHNVTSRPDPLLRPIGNDSGTTEVIVNKKDIVELFEADLHFAEMVNKTVIQELWEYIPVKAKVFVYPEPADLKKFLEEHRHLHHPHTLKAKKHKDEMEDSDVDDHVQKNRQKHEANIIRVLRKMSRKEQD